MSRRHLSLALAAIASLVVTACSSNPTAPQAQARAATSANADGVLTPPPVDTTGRSGWIGSGG